MLDRLTGGTKQAPPVPPQKRQKPSSILNVHHHQPQQQQQQHSLHSAALRNESYYMATNDTWSPGVILGQPQHINHSVLIEEDPEPMSP